MKKKSLAECLREREDWCMDGDQKSYHLLRKIREGSKRDIYVAEDDKERRVVLTVLNAEKVLEILRFGARREGVPDKEIDDWAMRGLQKYEMTFAESAAKAIGLKHEHVCEVYKVERGIDIREIVVVSEYMPGVDFSYASKCFKTIQKISLFVQVLKGMEFIHGAGFLHLNIKPKGIWIDLETKPPRLKLLDFGFAIPKVGYTGEYGGTPVYMAPETVCGGVVDQRADIYSCGVAFYECLAGYPPTEHRREAGADRKRLVNLVKNEGVFSPPSHYNNDIPQALDNIIMNLLDKDANKRPRDALDVQNMFYNEWPEESREMPLEKTSTLV